jgi:hypothetical protein
MQQQTVAGMRTLLSNILVLGIVAHTDNQQMLESKASLASLVISLLGCSLHARRQK